MKNYPERRRYCVNLYFVKIIYLKIVIDWLIFLLVIWKDELIVAQKIGYIILYFLLIYKSIST